MPHGQAVALSGLGHLQAFWRTARALPPIKRFLATLSAALPEPGRPARPA
jgi:hypothetical protein